VFERLFANASPKEFAAFLTRGREGIAQIAKLIGLQPEPSSADRPAITCRACGMFRLEPVALLGLAVGDAH
jgi:hypothetical protein